MVQPINNDETIVNNDAIIVNSDDAIYNNIVLPHSIDTLLNKLRKLINGIEFLIDNDAVKMVLKLDNSEICAIIGLTETYEYLNERRNFFFEFNGYDSEYQNDLVTSHPSNNVSIVCIGEEQITLFAEITYNSNERKIVINPFLQ